MNHPFSDKVSLTFQLAQLLRNQIHRGEWLPGTKLPPEVQLAEDFGVSVITVQRALKELEQEGLITRHRGRGTFVADLRPAIGNPANPEVLAFMFSDEFDENTDILEWKLVERPARLAEFGEKVNRLKRLKRRVYRGKRAWSFGTIYVLPEVAEKLKVADIKRFPMFRLMSEMVGLQLKDVDLDFYAQMPPPEVSSALDIDPVYPVMYFRGALRDVDERMLMVLELYFRSDDFAVRFHLDLTDEPKVKHTR